MYLDVFAILHTCACTQIGFHNRVETFKQDSQLDVVWKMYRVKSLVLSISAA